MLLRITHRVTKLERQTKYLPLTVIAALFLGGAAGKFPKPDLAALAVACGGAGVGMIVAMTSPRFATHVNETNGAIIM